MREHIHKWAQWGYSQQKCEGCDEKRPQPGFACRVCEGIPEHAEPCHTSVCNSCRTKLGLCLRGSVHEDTYFRVLARSRGADL